jgi:spermidine synthase
MAQRRGRALPRLRVQLVVLGLLFVATGFAALLAEQCFEKLLSNLVGMSTPAAAVVLAVYFLGLTLGAVFYGRSRGPRRHPLRTYARLEAGVAVWSLLLALGAGTLVVMLSPLLRLGADSFWATQALRALVALVWILPPTMLMGASFPAVVDTLESWRVPRAGRFMAGFYTLNLLGAIGGALVGPYVAFPHLGLTGVLLLTFVVDLLAAGVAAFFLRPGRTRVPSVEPSTASVPDATPVDVPLLILGLSCLSGFLFFSLEVLWTHLMTVVIGTSAYAFAAMLALVLLSLGLGGVLATVLVPGDRAVPSWAVGALMVLGSALLAWQYSRWPDVPTALIQKGSALTTFGAGEVLRWQEAARLLVLPATVLGMVYPGLFRLALVPVRDRGRSVALMSAWNSIGCVAGALATGFLLIPWLGSEATLRLVGLLLILGGVAVALRYGQGRTRLVVLVFGACVSLLWARSLPWNRLALTQGAHVYFAAHSVFPFTRLVSYQEDATGITTVVWNPSPTRPKGFLTLLTNGKFQANDAGEIPAQIAFALVPILHTPAPEDALVIGLGSGQSAAVVADMGFARIELAEISPAVAQAARRFFSHTNGRLLERPGVVLHEEDGRNYLLMRKKQFDLITIELSNVWFAGATSLYSREFYALARQRLKPGGVIQQWVQLHHLGTEEIGSIVATLHREFPYVSLWIYGEQGIVVGSLEEQTLEAWVPARLARHNPWEGQGGDAASEMRHLLASRLLAPADVDRMLAARHFVVNTDGNRFLEYATPRYNLSRAPWALVNRQALAAYATFPGHQLSGPWDPRQRQWVADITREEYRKALRLEPGDVAQGAAPSSAPVP